MEKAKRAALTCLLLLLPSGCVSPRGPNDDFMSLHQHVARKLAGRCDCESITTDEILGRSFDVVPRDSGCRILVFEREFFRQREWERRYTDVTNQVFQFLTRTNQTEKEAARGIVAMEQMQKLPGWRYKSIGVDVHLQTPEVVYDGMEKDQVKAQGIFDEIVDLLKPYQAVKRVW